MASEIEAADIRQEDRDRMISERACYHAHHERDSAPDHPSTVALHARPLSRSFNALPSKAPHAFQPRPAKARS